MFLVTFRCFVHFVITLDMIMHQGLHSEFMMSGCIVETVDCGKGLVAAIELHVWLS